MAHEVFLNPMPTAPDVFVQAMACQVNQNDVESVLQSQKLMLLRFEKTNEMLLNCNALSSARYTSACQEFKRHTQQLMEMKKDLESVFRRIKNIKTKLSVQYPSAFEACSNVFNVLEEASPEETVSQPISTSVETNPENSIQKTEVPPASSSCSQATTPSPVTSSSTSDTG